MNSSGITVKLGYLTPRELDAAGIDNRTLGLVAFGHRPQREAPQDCPYVWVDMPVLDGTTVFEVWHSDRPVIRETTDNIRTARNEEMLFGCLQEDSDRSIDAAGYDIYCRIFDLIDACGYSELLRVWNYFPRINAVDDGLERYRRFSVGRHDAFAAKNRHNGKEAPAACALGSRSGPLTVCFLAGRTSGVAIENPRQVNACDYPPQYGPRAPLFSRAMLCWPNGKPLLLVSGTASIVGHQTMHSGNAKEQAAETATNLMTVMAQARQCGFLPGSGAGLLLKAYVRHADQQPAIHAQLERSFGPAVNVVYLQADICRQDLLVEVEGVCLAGHERSH